VVKTVTTCKRVAFSYLL